MKNTYLLRKIFILAMTLATHFAGAKTDLSADSNLNSEVLKNGFKIAVYPNKEPPNRVSMRLLVRRGSACEKYWEKGIAHFTEHMAFNGTKNYPAGQMVEYFQRLGMAFGADTNAHTSFTETVYKLDMPEISDKLIDDGLLLLRDYADGILFEQKAIDNERSVIIAEKNSRDNQDYRKSVAEIEHYYDGSNIADRMPIGDMEVVSKINRDVFLKFYKETYRPENMVLVIVGDVDAKKISARAAKYFENMKPDANFANRLVEFGELEKTKKNFSFTDTNIDYDIVSFPISNASSSYAAIAVSKELGGAEDSYARRVRDIRLRVLSNAITARYLRIADSPKSKITSGNGGNFNFDTYAETMIMSAESPVGKHLDALEENFKQLFSLSNLTDAEIERAKQKVMTIIDGEIKAKTSRQSRSIANEIVSAYSDGEVYTSPEFDMVVAKDAFKDFNAAEAKALFKSMFDGAKMKIFVSDVKCESGDKLKNEARKILEKASFSKYTEANFAVENLIFSDFKGGEIAEKRVVKDLEITALKFENNVRANIKKTDFAKDQVLLKISFGNGLLSLPKGKPEYYMATNGLFAGGTKFQNASEIAAAQYALKMNLSISIEGNSFVLGGSSGVKDFPSMLKLAATLVADAGFREDGMDVLLKGAEASYRSYETDARAQMGFVPVRLLDASFNSIPGTFDNFKKIKMSDIKAWLEPVLKNSYMEISVVGAIDEVETEKLLAQTFGSLPQRDETKPDGAFASVALKPVGTEVKSTYLSDNEPVSIVGKMWLSCGRNDIVKMRTANVLGAILDDVLRKDIREKQGKVYSPYAYNNSSMWIKNVGFICALTAVVPEYNSELAQLLQKAGEKLIKGVSKDEFERAKIPLIKSVEANLRRNSYWIEAVLNLSQLNPQNLEMARSIKDGYANISLEAVVAMAKEVFAKKPYGFSIMPPAQK